MSHSNVIQQRKNCCALLPPSSKPQPHLLGVTALTTPDKLYRLQHEVPRYAVSSISYLISLTPKYFTEQFVAKQL
jgi:hypothetical protein